MSNSRFGWSGACLALIIFTAGCSETATNTNTNTGTTNTANVNANANTANANANVNTNANANGGLTREEFDKNKEKYTQEAKKLGRKVGAGANDAWIWTKTRAALTAADDLRDSTIEVDVENGVITLSGTVSNNEQVKKADTLAKGIDGQTGVQNKLKVSAEAGNANGNKNANAGNANTK